MNDAAEKPSAYEAQNREFVRKLKKITGAHRSPLDTGWLCHVYAKDDTIKDIGTNIFWIMDELESYKPTDGFANELAKNLRIEAKAILDRLNEGNVELFDGNSRKDLPDLPQQLKELLPELIAHLRLLEQESRQAQEPSRA